MPAGAETGARPPSDLSLQLPPLPTGRRRKRPASSRGRLHQLQDGRAGRGGPPSRPPGVWIVRSPYRPEEANSSTLFLRISPQHYPRGTPALYHRGFKEHRVYEDEEGRFYHTFYDRSRDKHILGGPSSHEE